MLIRTPYGRTTLGSRLFAIVFARRGFQVLVQSIRGSFGSGGDFRPFTTEHQDGLDTLAWVLPFLALALGLATTILIVRAWSKRPAPAAAGAVLPVTGPELDRFRKKEQEDTEI